MVKEAIIHFKSKVAHTIHYLGHNASMSAMINKLNTVNGAVVSYDVLMWKFYQVTQEQGESISNYLICIEGVLNDIKTKFPAWVPEMESDQLLWSRFHSGLHSWIHDGIRDMFRNLAYDVTTVMKAAGDLEDEHVLEQGQWQVTTKAASVEDLVAPPTEPEVRAEPFVRGQIKNESPYKGSQHSDLRV